MRLNPPSAGKDARALDPCGSAMWMGSVQSYGVVLFEIELTAARAPGDYAIINRQIGEQSVMSFGLSVDGHHDHVEAIDRQNRLGRLVALSPG